MKTPFRWNRIAIVALILTGIPVLLCLGLVVFGPGLAHSIHQSTWKNDPIKAAEIAHSLADYTLPAGYQETSYAQVMDASQVILAPADGSVGMTILFMQESMAMNDQEIVTEMEDAWAKEIGAHTYATSRTSTGPPIRMAIKKPTDQATGNWRRKGNGRQNSNGLVW